MAWPDDPYDFGPAWAQGDKPGAAALNDLETAVENISARVVKEAPINPEWDEFAGGAVGDGATEDSAAFAALFSGISSLGADIILPARRSFLIANLTLTGKTNVTFHGPGTLKRKPTGVATDANWLIHFNGCEDVRLKGVNVNLNNVERYGGVVFYDCDGVWVEGGCHFYDSNLNSSWSTFDHYAMVFSKDAGSGCSNVWVSDSLFEDSQVEVDATQGFHILDNTSRRAAGTMAIGCFAISGGETLADGELVGNIIVDPRQAGLVIRHDPGGLSNQTWRNLTLAHNTIRHDTATANAGIAPIIIGNLTGTTTGTGNVRENIRVIDNNVWIDSDLSARTVPAILWMDNAVAAGQDFRRCELSRNRLFGPRSGDWSVDVRRFVDGDVVGNVVRGAVSHGQSFDNFSGSRIMDNRSMGTTQKFSLSNSLGGNWIEGNEEL